MSLIRNALIPILVLLLPGLVQAGWVRQNSVTKRYLDSVCFIDTARGWAAGQSLIKTTDGGLHWTVLIDSVGTGYWDDISFSDSLHGWSVTYSPYLISGIVNATTDGGMTWHEQVRDTYYYFRGVKFVSPLHGYVAGGYLDETGSPHSRMLTTTDGGTTWSRYTIPDSTSRELVDVDAIGPFRAWALGNGDSCSLSTDGGATWFSGYTGSYSFNSVSFGTLNSGWGATTNGKILASTDGGMTWHFQVQCGAFWLSIKAVDSLHAWAAGDSGRIWATTDGGQAWFRQISGTTDFLWNITFIDTLRGWAVLGGPDSLILHTEDGGTGVEEEPLSVPLNRASGNFLSTHPNPFTSFTRILGHEAERFALYDISGRKVGDYKGDRIGMDVGPGVYFLVPEDKGGKPVRVVKVK